MRAFLMAATGLLTMAFAAAPFDRSAWREDYAQLKSELVARYANLAWKASPSGGADLPDLDRRTTAALSSAQTDADAANAIRAFVAGFHDGHLSELPTLAPQRDAVEEPDDPALDPDAPVAGCAALSAASTAPVAFSLPFETLPGFRLLSDGLTSTFRTGMLVRSGVSIGLVRIQAFRIQAFPSACLHAWASLRKAGEPITARALHAGTRRQWLQDLAGALRALHGEGATVLLVDVGNNTGGDDSGDWAARLFTDHEVRSARLRMVDAPLAAGYFDEQVDELKNARATTRSPQARAVLEEAQLFFSKQKAAIGTAHCDLTWVWQEQRPWSPANCNRLLDAGYADGFRPGLSKGAFGDRDAAIAIASASQAEEDVGAWSDPTYVLSDHRTYSSAEMFSAVMQDNRIAKLIGEHTGGDGCGFMTDAPPVQLVHSRLRFRIANCMRLRADGSNEEAGVTPDLPLEPMESESDRARGERAMRDVVVSFEKGPRMNGRRSIQK